MANLYCPSYTSLVNLYQRIYKIFRLILLSLLKQHLICRINQCQSTGPHHILFNGLTGE